MAFFLFTTTDILLLRVLIDHTTTQRDTAMVQFATSQQAYLAVQNLSGTPFLGSVISVNASKHKDVQMPKETDEESQMLTRDYTNHPAHRYKQKSMINPKNVNPPSQVFKREDTGERGF